MAISKIKLGKLIKEARKIKGEKIGKKYTGQMLADDVGVSRSYIGDIESGRIYPSFLLLTKIAKACEIPLSFFEDDEGMEISFSNIYELCDKNDLSMDTLCKMLDIKKESLECIKNNILPKDDTLDKIADYFDVTFDYLKGYVDDPKSIITEFNPKNFKKMKNQKNTVNNTSSKYPFITDVKQAMEVILAQPGLMLNGEMLSDESKIALANAINMGLAYAEQMQKKEKEQKAKEKQVPTLKQNTVSQNSAEQEKDKETKDKE